MTIFKFSSFHQIILSLLCSLLASETYGATVAVDESSVSDPSSTDPILRAEWVLNLGFIERPRARYDPLEPVVGLCQG